MSAIAQRKEIDSPPGANRRKSRRIPRVMPVVVVWSRRDGVRLRERAETEDISTHGALLLLETRLAPGTPLNLSRPGTQLKTVAHVVRTIKSSPEALLRVAIELSVPAEEFWEEEVS